MNLWARFDEEDPDMVHFSAAVPVPKVCRGRPPIRRLLATVHIDDLGLLFEDDGLQLLDRLRQVRGPVFLALDVIFPGDDE